MAIAGYIDSTTGKVENQKGSGGSPYVSQPTVTRNVWPNDLYETSFLLGDEGGGVSVAASGTQATGNWEVGKVRKGEASVCVVITGTGTCKLDANLSRDGATNEFTVPAADIDLTGLTVGTYLINLSNVDLLYSHFINFLVTETGTANAVVVTVFGMGRNG
jgi:hypothetical protein